MKPDADRERTSPARRRSTEERLEAAMRDDLTAAAEDEAEHTVTDEAGDGEPSVDASPDDEIGQLCDLIDGRMAPAEERALRARLTAEPALRRLFDELRLATGDLRPPAASRRRPGVATAWWGAAAATLLVAVGAAFWLRLGARELASEQAWLPDLMRQVSEVAAGGPPPRPPSVERLASRAGVLLDDAAPPAAPDAFTEGADGVELLAPRGTRVSDAQPRFQWRDGADSGTVQGTTYAVEVFDLDFEPVASSGTLQGSSWTPEEPLPAGLVLLWQLRVSRPAGEQLVVPAPPVAEARFEVLGADEAGELEQRLEVLEHTAFEESQRELARILLLAGAGLRDEARSELTAARHLSGDVVARLRRDL
ncbi:MAG: hypothetical protein DWQ36_16970 [Acidobacteria bacterium]|nr:MAG: hypothetical protein DWQ36_16970 [Acidobacteriota bacterium]